LGTKNNLIKMKCQEIDTVIFVDFELEMPFFFSLFPSENDKNQVYPKI